MTLFNTFRDRDTRMEGSVDGVRFGDFENFDLHLFDEVDGVCVLGEGAGSNIPDVLNDVIDLSEGGPQQAVAVDADAGFMEYFGDSVDEPIYEDLSPAHSKKMFHTEVSTKTLTDWTRHYPQVWTSDDVYSWIMHVATDPRSGIDFTMFRGENFHVDGQTLCTMSVEQFRRADAVYGEMLYCCLHDLLTNCSPLQGLPSFGTFFSKQGSYSTSNWTEVGDENIDFFPEDESSSSIDDGYSSPGISRTEQISPMLPATVEQLSALNSTPTAVVTDPYSGIEHYKQKPTKHSHSATQQKHASPPQWEPKDEACYTPVSKKRANRPAACRKPRNSLSSSSDNDSDDSLTSVRRTAPRKPGDGFKGKHLWEFIRDLLHNNQSNPCLIRWEDRDEGIFRIVNSKEVARLWGNRKGNSDMTYEKLSRAMRFCRTANYFENVPRDRNLPRKLCFKFGPKAEDWQCPTSSQPAPAPLSNRLRRLAIN